MKKIIISVSLIISLLLVLGMTVPASASPEKILVYNGDNSFNNGYTKFGQAVGREVDTLDVLPEDLSAYICIILPANRDEFSAETVTALVSFVNNGGKILAQADAVDMDFDPSLLGAITNLNGLADALDSNMYLEATAIHTGYNITGNIDPSPFTAGVDTIFYGWTSKVLVGPGAYSLVNAKGDLTPKITIIGAEKIGEGWFILCGDLNIFSDFSNNGYTEWDNGVLAKNIVEYDLVINGPPEVNAGSDQTVDLGTDVLVYAEYTDPGATDTHTANISWGDGSSEPGTITEPGSIGTVTGNYNYAWPGTYEVTVEVTDNNGDVGSDTFTVVVLPVPDEMVDSIGDDIEEMELPESVENSLTTSLDNANKVLEDSNQNNDGSAINSLEAFINKLEAQRGKKIPADVADDLIARAQEIIDALTGS